MKNLGKLGKFNANILVFASIFLFIVCGMFTKSFIGGVLLPMINNIKTETSFSEYIEKTINDIDNNSKNVSYKAALINLNSFMLKLTGTEMIKKDDGTIIKMSNGYLSGLISKIDDQKLDIYAHNISELNNFSNEHNIPFLYVMAPQKGYSTTFPYGADNYLQENCKGLLERLSSMNVPYLNLFETLEAKGITEEEAFFVTDHHWKPNTGFMAAEEICKTLNEKYGFSYDSAFFDIKNYNVKTYEDWFLGSQGKKVGLYFTDFGADDIDLITPKFSTDFTVTKPIVNESVTGSFEKTHIVKKYIEEKDYYALNTYAAYTGGDFHIQIVENHNNTNGKKILIVRNSFACVVTPFLSLTAKELHILDIRNNDYMPGERVSSVSSYIEQIDPDYVIVLYDGVPANDEFFVFDLEE